MTSIRSHVFEALEDAGMQLHRVDGAMLQRADDGDYYVLLVGKGVGRLTPVPVWMDDTEEQLRSRAEFALKHARVSAAAPDIASQAVGIYLEAGIAALAGRRYGDAPHVQESETARQHEMRKLWEARRGR